MTDFSFDYQPAPESLTLDLQKKYGLFIDNQMVSPHSKQFFPTINPANEQPLSLISNADQTDVDRAVQAAAAALPAWRALDPKVRSQYLFKLARLLQERIREFAVCEAIDGGKVITEGRLVDLPLAVQHFFYHAGWADKLQYLARDPQPVGVVAAVIPWNFPTMMLAWKIAPALACANTIVLKPAETTSLTALLFSEIVVQAGLPPGVINIVTGAGETGAALVAHPLVDKIAFTGSTAVGKMIASTNSSKRLTLELGGKSANIVFDDCDLDQAVEGVVDGIFFNRGHVCCAGSRLLVQENIAERLISKLKKRMETLIVGDPLDKNSDIGPINSQEQLQLIEKLVNDSPSGAGMYQSDGDLPKQGYWFKPTLFTNAEPGMAITEEEIFGPVLAISTFRTPAEAVQLANSSRYGLVAGVWTNHGSLALKVSSQLKAGVIWQNTYNQFDPSSPFGGYKESGYGREGGRQGLAAYFKDGKK